jgi:hypothetical protein
VSNYGSKKRKNRVAGTVLTSYKGTLLPEEKQMRRDDDNRRLLKLLE